MSTGSSPGAGSDAGTGAGTGGIALAVRNTSVHGGELVIRRPLAERPPEGRGFHERLEGPWAGDYHLLRFRGIDARIGAADLLDPEVRGETFEVESLSVTAEIVGEPFTVTGLAGRIRREGRALELDLGRLRLGATEISAAGSLEWGNPEGVSGRFAVDAPTLDLPDFRWLEPALPAAEGSVAGEISLEAGRLAFRAAALDLRSGGSRVTGEVAAGFGSGPAFVEADLALDPLGLGELAPWVPLLAEAGGSVTGPVSAAGPAGALEVRADLAFEDRAAGDRTLPGGRHGNARARCRPPVGRARRLARAASLRGAPDVFARGGVGRRGARPARGRRGAGGGSLRRGRVRARRRGAPPLEGPPLRHGPARGRGSGARPRDPARPPEPRGGRARRGGILAPRRGAHGRAPGGRIALRPRVLRFARDARGRARGRRPDRSLRSRACLPPGGDGRGVPSRPDRARAPGTDGPLRCALRGRIGDRARRARGYGVAHPRPGGGRRGPARARRLAVQRRGRTAPRGGDRGVLPPLPDLRVRGAGACRGCPPGAARGGVLGRLARHARPRRPGRRGDRGRHPHGARGRDPPARGDRPRYAGRGRGGRLRRERRGGARAPGRSRGTPGGGVPRGGRRRLRRVGGHPLAGGDERGVAERGIVGGRGDGRARQPPAPPGVRGDARESGRRGSVRRGQGRFPSRRRPRGSGATRPGAGSPAAMGGQASSWISSASPRAPRRGSSRGPRGSGSRMRGGSPGPSSSRARARGDRRETRRGR